MFGPIDDQPCGLPPITFSLREGAKPHYAPPRRLSPADHEFVEAQVREWRALGIVEPTNSPWSAQAVVATRADGKRRLCFNYRRLNDATVRTHWPLPIIPELLNFFRGKRFYSKWDMASGYLQVALSQTTQDLVAFSTASGSYTFTRLPFGPTNGPSEFQRRLQEALADLRDVRNYLDDTTVASEDFPGFLAALDAFLDRCQRLHLRLSVRKALIAPKKLPFLGHVVSEAGVELDPARREAIGNLQAPRDKAALRSLVGLLNFFSPHVPAFSVLAAPLFALYPAGAHFVWGPAQERALSEIKRHLLECPTLLAHPNPELQTVVCSDASNDGMGAVVFQLAPGAPPSWDPKSPPESPRPPVLALVSHRWSAAERKLSTGEQEGLVAR